MSRPRRTAAKQSTTATTTTAKSVRPGSIKLPANVHYPCIISSKWYRSEYGIVQRVDFGQYLAYSKGTTGATFLPEDEVQSVDELKMDNDERPFYGYCNSRPKLEKRGKGRSNSKEGLVRGGWKEELLTLLNFPWMPYLLCPREGCPYHDDKHFASLSGLRKHYRYNCKARGGPKHECQCQIKCEKYVLDLGPEIPAEGYKQYRYDMVDGRNVRTIRAGWYYKTRVTG